jgi:hypothetical protein
MALQPESGHGLSFDPIRATAGGRVVTVGRLVSLSQLMRERVDDEMMIGKGKKIILHRNGLVGISMLGLITAYQKLPVLEQSTLASAIG